MMSWASLFSVFLCQAVLQLLLTWSRTQARLRFCNKVSLLRTTFTSSLAGQTLFFCLGVWPDARKGTPPNKKKGRACETNLQVRQNGLTPPNYVTKLSFLSEREPGNEAKTLMRFVSGVEGSRQSAP